MAPWAHSSYGLLVLIVITAIPGRQCVPLKQQPKQSSRARHHIREHHVPRIIHQSWKDTNVPEGFRPWQDSWKKNHPGWEYR